MLAFKIIYWVAMVLEIVIRTPYRKALQGVAKTEQRETRTEKALLGLLTISMFLVPLVYSVTNWLDFANYSLPDWLGWLGVAIMAGALLVFARAHKDLKTFWSPTLEIYAGHTLMTSGIYAYIRHPMYASQWLWCIAQALLLQNWIAGPIGLVVWLFFYLLRTRAEEQMMLDTFGEEYRAYMDRTGGVLPRF